MKIFKIKWQILKNYLFTGDVGLVDFLSISIGEEVALR